MKQYIIFFLFIALFGLTGAAANAQTTALTVMAPVGVHPQPTIVFNGQQNTPFTVLHLLTSGGDVLVSSITVQRTGLANDAAFSEILILDENGQQIGKATLNTSTHTATIPVSFTIKDSTVKVITIAANRTSGVGYGGQTASFTLLNINSDASVLSGLPVTGTSHTLSDLTVGNQENSTNLDTQKPFVDMKLNGLDGHVKIKEGSSLTVTWNSQNAKLCVGYGQSFKGNIYGDWGAVGKQLPTSGFEVFTPSYNLNAITEIGIQCATESDRHAEKTRSPS